MADTIINTGNVLPEFEEKRSFDRTTPGDTKTTEVVTQAPERIEAAKGLEAAGAGEVTAAEEGQARANAAAPIQAAATAGNADIREHAMQQRLQATDFWASELAKAKQRTQQRTAELDAMSSPSLWGNTDNQGKVMRGVALALGGIGDAIQKAAMVRIGHAPPAIDTVGDIINGILNQQREHIATLKDNVVRAKTGEADVLEGRRQMLADVDLREISMLKRIEALTAARLAAMGKTPEQIAADENLAAVKARIAKTKADYADKLVGHITTKQEEATTKVGTDFTKRAPTAQNARPSERQMTDSFLGKNLADALDVIEAGPKLTPEQLATAQDQELSMSAASNAAGKGAVGNVAVKAGRELGLVPRSQTQGLPPEAAKVVVAGNIAKEMVARKLSGGAIVTDEDRQNAEKYMIHAEDSDEVRSYKKGVLRNMAKEMMATSGQAGETVSAAVPSAKPGHVPPSGAKPTQADAAREGAIRQIKSRKLSKDAAMKLVERYRITRAELQ